MSIVDRIKDRNDKLKVRQDVATRRNRDYWETFTTPVGKKVLEDLEKMFGGVPLKRSPDGRVDSDASMVAIGSQEVIKTIHERIKYGQVAR